MERKTLTTIPKIFVEILESRQKILLLTESAHPDIFALTSAIEQNDNYEVDQQFVKEFKGDYSSYSLLIAFHTEVNNAPLPTWYVWGANTTSQQTDWLQLNAYVGQSSEVLVNSEEFSYFQIDEEWDDWAQQLPPLVVPFANVDYLMDYQNVFSQIEKGLPRIDLYYLFIKGRNIVKLFG